MTNSIKYFYIIIILFTLSCKGQKKTDEKIVSKNVESINYDSGDVTTNGYLDKSGNMWFTTTKEGVFKYDGKTFKNFTVKDGLCSNRGNAVIEDNNGFLWFATDKGLCKYDGKTFITFHLPKEKPEDISPETGFSSRETDEIISIIQDKNNDFWVGTIAKGAYHFDGNKFTSYLKFRGRLQPPNNNIYSNVIQSIVEEDDGNIWFTSQTHGGISKYDGKNFTHFSKDDGLPDDMVFSSFKDKDGKLWFGTLDNGFFSYKEGSFNFFNNIDIPYFMVSCFYQDKTGTLWIGSFRERTVSLFDGKNISLVPFDKDKKLVEIRFITEDKDGNIWFGGRYGLLYRYDGKELKDYTQLKRNL